MKPLNSLGHLLAGVRLEAQAASLPAQQASPKPERSKVVSIPTRVPVNRQAAAMFRKTSWIDRPFDPPPTQPKHPDVARLEAELKTAHNQLGTTTAELGRLRILARKEREAATAAREQLAADKATIQRLQTEVAKLKAACALLRKLT